MELVSLSFGADGWGADMLSAAGTTVAVAISGTLLGAVIGLAGATMAVSRHMALRRAALGYVAIMRGVPDLLVIYLFYFGGSQLLTALARGLGIEGFVGLPAFATGVVALAVVSGAYLTEVFRGAVLAVPRGEIEAAIAYGMSGPQRLRRILLPVAARHALPGLGNVWQLVLKESALISVVGLVELMRQAQIGAGSTRQPFTFFLTAAGLYLAVAWLTGRGFARAEARVSRGLARGGIGRHHD